MVNSTPWYQWVFSGIGVLLLSWFSVWVYRRYRRTPPVEKPPESASQVNIADSTVIGPVAGRDISIGTFVQHGSESQDDEYRQNPTPIEIAESLDKVALYLQSSVADGYSGVKVRWQLAIRGIHPTLDDDRYVDVGLLAISETKRSLMHPYINAVVRLEDYPILKTIHDGQPVEVSATIDRVKGNSRIDLKDVRLKFLPQD